MNFWTKNNIFSLLLIRCYAIITLPFENTLYLFLYYKEAFMFNFPMTYVGIPLSQLPKDITDVKLIHSLKHIGEMVQEDLQLDRAEMYLKTHNPEYAEDCIQDEWADRFVMKLVDNRDKLLSKYIDFRSNHAGSGETPAIFGFYVHGNFGEMSHPTPDEMKVYEKELEEFKTLMKDILDEDIYNLLIENNAIRLDVNNHTT